jgi:hypothetical protein
MRQGEILLAGTLTLKSFTAFLCLVLGFEIDNFILFDDSVCINSSIPIYSFFGFAC